MLFRHCAVLLLFVGCTPPDRQPERVADPLTLGEILACNDSVVGGSALRRVRQVEYDLHIVEPTFEVRGLYRADRAGTMRIDIFAEGQRVFSEGWDGTAGWQLPQGRTVAVPTSEAGAAALRHGLEQPGHLWTLQDMKGNGHSVELDEAADSTDDAHVVRLTLADGFQSWFWIDAASCLVTKTRDFRAFHPDVVAEERWIENHFRDYRTDAGVTRASTTLNVDVMSGDTVGRTMLLAVRTEPIR